MSLFADTTKEESIKSETKSAASMKDLYGSKTTAAKNDKSGTAVKNGRAYRVLVKPLVTEKASVVASENKYIFSVDRDANKIEIAKAINEVYGIKPTEVNVIRVKGKKVRHGKTQGQRKDWKKAVVTLPAGKSIKVYEGV
ncbi:MAG: 50S ribosomal protein L23 [Parcubacteria group bacterium GW2011_GWE2_39_37]|nr:MAG: 50S ribosomal protein L23 [Parcubacteria group bacterium GW2011_GWE2_39_37]